MRNCIRFLRLARNLPLFRKLYQPANYSSTRGTLKSFQWVLAERNAANTLEIMLLSYPFAGRGWYVLLKAKSKKPSRRRRALTTRAAGNPIQVARSVPSRGAPNEERY